MSVSSDSSKEVTSGPNTLDEESPNIDGAMKKSAIVALIIAAIVIVIVVFAGVEIYHAIFSGS